MASLAQILFEYVSPFLAVIILVLNIAEVYIILRQKIRIKYSVLHMYSVWPYLIFLLELPL